jgi:CubicO group peptidase (beta-lactamase class C family)
MQADGGSAPTLRHLLRHWVASRQVAGLQYLFASAGGIVFEHCDGLADAQGQEPVTGDTQFNLYSITKPLTATLVARLGQHAAISLDEPIAQAAGLAALAGFGTVRDTLTHRAGFANPMPLRWTHRAEQDAGFDEPTFVQQRLVDAAALGRKSPRYSNVGYLALGRAVERATGLGFREALHRHLIDALSLGPGEHLGFTPEPGASWSPGHLRKFGLLNLALGGFASRRDVVADASGPWVRLHRHHVNGSAYGGLIGNARGLARFGMAMLGHGTSLDPSLRRQVCTPEPRAGGERTLAWFMGHLAGQPWLGHAGGGLGAYGELRLYPELAAVSVLLTNRPGLRDARALDRLDSIWLQAACGA